MTTPVHVFDNQALPGTVSSSQYDFNTIVVGSRFTLAGSRTVYNLLWWNGGNGGTPASVKLWSDAGTLLATALVSGPYQIGWNTIALGTPVALTAGTYRVSGYWQQSRAYWWIANASVATPPTGISWPTNWRCYTTGSDSFPSTADNTYGPWLFDVALDAVDPAAPAPNPPSTTGDISNQLADWLISTSDNTHQTDGLPWLTKAAVDATKTELDAVQTALTEIGNVTDSAGSIVSLPLKALLARYAADITTIESYLPSTQSRTGAAGTGGGYGTIVDDVAAIISGGSVTTSLEKLREQMQLTPDPATDPRWVVGATETGTGEGLVSTGADMYRLTVSGWASAQAEIVIGGTVTWLPRLGWWAPIRDGFVGPRGFVDFETTDLRWPTQFMHGAVLGLPPEVSWSCACYQLDR